MWAIVPGVLVTIALLLWGCSSQSTADGQAVGYVVGRVSDTGGSGVPGARVDIEGLGPELDAPTTRGSTTDAQGMYSVVFTAFLRSEVTTPANIAVAAPAGFGLRDTVVMGTSITLSIEPDTTRVDIILSQ